MAREPRWRQILKTLEIAITSRIPGISDHIQKPITGRSFEGWIKRSRVCDGGAVGIVMRFEGSYSLSEKTPQGRAPI